MKLTTPTPPRGSGSNAGDDATGSDGGFLGNLTVRMCLVVFLRCFLPPAVPLSLDVLDWPPRFDGSDPLYVLWPFNTDALWVKHTAATRLCAGLFTLIRTLEQRARRGLRIAGVPGKSQRFRVRDHKQALPKLDTLPQESRALCLKLAEDLPVLLRLLRAAQRSWRDENPQWELCFRSAVIVILRLLQVCKLLLKHTGGFYTDVCLRWALRQGWEALCGPETPLPEALKDVMGPQAMPLSHEQEVFTVLLNEEKAAKKRWEQQMSAWRRAGRRGPPPKQEPVVPPPPLAAVFAAWKAGDLPPELLGPKLTAETGARVRFWV